MCTYTYWVPCFDIRGEGRGGYLTLVSGDDLEIQSHKSRIIYRTWMTLLDGDYWWKYDFIAKVPRSLWVIQIAANGKLK